MAQRISQTIDFTVLAMQKMHSTCETLSQSAQKGTITRMWSACPLGVAFVMVCVVLAMVLGAALVYLAMVERTETRNLNAYIPSEPTLVSGLATVNMKGNK